MRRSGIAPMSPAAENGAIALRTIAPCGLRQRLPMKRSASDKTRGPSGERPIDFGELPTYVGYQVRRAQARLFSELEAALKPFDLTPGSFGVLTLIHANPGVTQGRLAAAFGVDKSTLSPVVYRLESRGLVRREVLASDRRRHALFLAPAAEPTYGAARDRTRAVEAAIAARLTRAEQRELARLLARLQGEGGPDEA
jgi:DNA-binding MarR family transcriptional regulator